jgi:hypothetical protein
MRLAPALLLLTLVTGCSSFNRDYNLATAMPLHRDSLEGPWTGTWQSQAGHGGNRIRALVTKTADPDTYHAHFRATFWLLFEADQETDLKITSTNPVKATGQQDLGPLAGGVYTYNATLTPTTLDATYQSKYDHGLFKLHRP